MWALEPDSKCLIHDGDYYHLIDFHNKHMGQPLFFSYKQGKQSYRVTHLGQDHTTEVN